MSCTKMSILAGLGHNCRIMRYNVIKSNLQTIWIDALLIYRIVIWVNLQIKLSMPAVLDIPYEYAYYILAHMHKIK